MSLNIIFTIRQRMNKKKKSALSYTVRTVYDTYTITFQGNATITGGALFSELLA